MPIHVSQFSGYVVQRFQDFFLQNNNLIFIFKINLFYEIIRGPYEFDTILESILETHYLQDIFLYQL